MSEGSYRKSRITPVLVTVPLPPSYRIMLNRYRSDPLGTQPADSRFCAQNGGFTVLYTAPEFATAFVETVVRDRFTRRQICEVKVREITARFWARISMKPEASLTLIDLRGNGCTLIGAPTDTVKAKNHAAGRAFAKAIYAKHVDVDGIVYTSRLTEKDIYVMFDRALGNLDSIQIGPLETHPDLPKVLQQYRIGLVT